MSDRGRGKPAPMQVEPVTLAGRFVRLEPLRLDHVDDLVRVGLEPELWQLQLHPLETPDDMREYVEIALDEQRRGISLPFAIVDLGRNLVVGSTRYGDISQEHHRLEIGWTWLTSSAQRTPINTEAKYLLLTHAFERLGAIRVQLKTDVLNLQSRQAITRIGAREEGIFRNHMIADSGRIRDSVYFSIIAAEWPAVKARLEEKLW